MARSSTLLLALVLLLPLPPAAAPSAATTEIHVTTTADEITDDGDCSLREAVLAAETDAPRDACPAGSGPDVIRLPAGVFVLTIPPDGTPNDRLDGDLDIVTDLTIRGAGARRTILDGNDADRILHVTTPEVHVMDLTIRNGRTTDPNGGGAVWNVTGKLHLVRVTITGSDALSGNGGGVVSQNPGAVLNVRQSTIVDNHATASDGNGGGIAIMNASVGNVVNSTITGNTADQSGGGVFLGAITETSMHGVTITQNVANADVLLPAGQGGGLAHNGASLSLRGTIVAGNEDLAPNPTGPDPDCSGDGISSLGHNLLGVASVHCNISTQPTDLTGVDPLLRPLADNGGPTDTHALRPSSPAVKARPRGACGADDQRGAPRRGRCDIGAYWLTRCRGAIVNRVGTGGRDRLRGTPKRDGILGLGGADTIRGGKGNDAICAGPGRDVLIGGAGGDVLVGEGGADVLRGGGGRDLLLGGPGGDALRGGPGRDRCRQGKGRGPVSGCER